MSQHTSSLPYRADIDGLRAIAVLAVLFYHANIPGFSGGYVGVDIFFVISGYLITSIIMKDIDNESFSFSKFYERRIRRIFPALFTILFFSLLVSLILFDPINFKNFGESLAATSLSLGNILFWSQAGYFDSPSHLKPLLHTWSLGVEEQFYIFFPLILWLIARRSKKFIPGILIAIALISFIFSAILVNQDDNNSAFYLPYLRAWELMIGGILVFNIFPLPKNKVAFNFLNFTGFILIIAPILFYNENTPFPGLAAFPAVGGTALLIFLGYEAKGLVERILSTPLLVFIGKISYSLYLWHWPILVFGKYYLIRDPNTVEVSIFVLLSFGFSILSWYFVEKPFRKTQSANRSAIFIWAAIVVIIMAGAGATIYLQDGFKNRFSNQENFDKINIQNWNKWVGCDYNENIQSTPPFCDLGAQTAKPSFLIWGDSHAHALASALDHMALRLGMHGYITFMQSCPPLLDIRQPKGKDCVQYNDMVLAKIKENADLKNIILISRWTLYAEGTRYKDEDGPAIILMDVLKENKKPSITNTSLLELGLKRTIEELTNSGKNIIVVAPVPEIGYDVPSAFSMATRTNRDVNTIVAPSRYEFIQRSENALHIIDNIHDKFKISIINPSELLCDKDICQVAIGKNILYRDDDHLSEFGADFIMPLFEKAFANLAK